MRNTRRPPQRPFKPPAPSISIWQGGPANRRPRCARPASAISSSPAATRWRCCRKPGGGWSEHDGEQTRPVLTGGCQCGAVRFALSMRAGQDQHLPLPDVPEGVGRALCLLRRHRARGFHLDPRQAGVVPVLLHRRARFLRRLRHAAELSADRRPPDRDHDRQRSTAPTGWCRRGNMEPNPGSAGWSASPICRARPRSRITGRRRWRRITSHQHPDHD